MNPPTREILARLEAAEARADALEKRLERLENPGLIVMGRDQAAHPVSEALRARENALH